MSGGLEKKKKANNYIETRHNHYKKGESVSYTCKDCRNVCKAEYIPCSCHICEDWGSCDSLGKLISVWCDNCKMELIDDKNAKSVDRK